MALGQLKFTEALLERALQLRRCVRVRSIEIHPHRLRITVRQASTPARRNDNRGFHVVTYQISFVLRVGWQRTPRERFVFADDIDEPLRLLRRVTVDEKRRHIGRFTRFECVAKD